MKVKELYNHITSRMTPEEALMKLLEGGLIQYEKLKFDAQGEPVHPIIIISMASMDMGWQMAVEQKEGNMRGISVGTEDYMKTIFPAKN